MNDEFQTGFYDKPDETFEAIRNLVNKGIIKVRNLAYEFANQK